MIKFKYCLLESLKEAKYIGLTIRQDLKWKRYVNNISMKAVLIFMMKNVIHQPVQALYFYPITTYQCYFVVQTCSFCKTKEWSWNVITMKKQMLMFLTYTTMQKQCPEQKQTFGTVKNYREMVEFLKLKLCTIIL